MFGCIAFFMNGNLAVGVRGDELIVRLAPAEASGALAESGVRVFDPTGRPMKGWVVVGASALKTPKSIAHWVQRGVSYASSLPKK